MSSKANKSVKDDETQIETSIKIEGDRDEHTRNVTKLERSLEPQDFPFIIHHMLLLI